MLAAQLANDYLLFFQVNRGIADGQAGQIQQRSLLRRLQGQRIEAEAQLLQVELHCLAQCQAVISGNLHHAVLEFEGHDIAHIGPDGLELGIVQFKVAAGIQRVDADVAGPVEVATVGAARAQTQGGIVVRQGAEIMQFQIQ